MHSRSLSVDAGSEDPHKCTEDQAIWAPQVIREAFNRVELPGSLQTVRPKTEHLTTKDRVLPSIHHSDQVPNSITSNDHNRKLPVFQGSFCLLGVNTFVRHGLSDHPKGGRPLTLTLVFLGVLLLY